MALHKVRMYIAGEECDAASGEWQEGKEDIVPCL